MKKNGIGGSRTNLTGLKAEGDILYKIESSFIDLIKNKKVVCGQKSAIYKYDSVGLKFDSKLIDTIKYKPQPDIFIYFIDTKVLWIIEIKNQDTTGTGWEKFEFGLFGYKNDVYQRVFNNLTVNVEGVYCGQQWNKIKYLDDVKMYIKNTYSKNLYSEHELDKLISFIIKK